MSTSFCHQQTSVLSLSTVHKDSGTVLVIFYAVPPEGSAPEPSLLTAFSSDEGADVSETYISGTESGRA